MPNTTGAPPAKMGQDPENHRDILENAREIHEIGPDDPANRHNHPQTEPDAPANPRDVPADAVEVAKAGKDVPEVKSGVLRKEKEVIPNRRKKDRPPERGSVIRSKVVIEIARGRNPERP